MLSFNLLLINRLMSWINKLGSKKRRLINWTKDLDKFGKNN